MDFIHVDSNHSNLTNNSSRKLNSFLSHSCGELIAICAIVVFMWLIIILGNGLVISAIATDRTLKGMQNWFIVSLASSDLLLGILVLPLSLVHELFNRWIFGSIICHLWLAVDVLLCTASIMNLCLISIDRYFSIKFPLSYMQSRNTRKTAAMIAAVWLLSAIICLPPLLGWRKPQESEHTCELTNDIGYVLYSTIGSFYIPLIIIIILYTQIFFEAQRRLRLRASGFISEEKKNTSNSQSTQNFKSSIKETSLKSEISSSICFHEKKVKNNPETFNQKISIQRAKSRSMDLYVMESGSDYPLMNKRRNVNVNTATVDIRKRIKSVNEHEQFKNFIELKKQVARRRERRAILVLGLILCAFIVCWLPFFTTYIVDSVCHCVNITLFKLFFWLGYFNSALNPLIYTIFNSEYRRAVMKVLRFGNR